jgi:hypothetical protein
VALQELRSGRPLCMHDLPTRFCLSPPAVIKNDESMTVRREKCGWRFSCYNARMPSEQNPAVHTKAKDQAGYCETARSLLDLCGAALQNVMRLHELQFLALVEGDTDSGRFDILIHEANEQKQNAKYAYLNHLQVHGCSSGRDLENIRLKHSEAQE